MAGANQGRRPQRTRRDRIVTADDGGLLWRRSLAGPDWSDYSLTVELLKAKLDPLSIQILLDSVAQLPDDFRQKDPAVCQPLLSAK